MNKEYDPIIDKASISVLDKTERLLVKSIFNFDNSNIGVVVVLFLSLSVLGVTIFFGKDLFTIIFLFVLGGGMSIFSILVLLKQIIDFVEIGNGKIRFRNSLRIKVFKLNPKMRIIVKAETVHVESSSNSGSDIRIIELFLIDNKIEYRIFDFQVPNVYKEIAEELGLELADNMNYRIKEFNKIN